MSLLYVCPGGHHWESADSASATGTHGGVCPICGGAGTVWDGNRPTLFGGDTLPPTGLPPLVRPLTILDEPARPRTQATIPSLPTQISCYEIIRLLGRGGMGVVYLARHVALQRLVALKMIIAGTQDSPELLGRFRLEAEAVARLKHPHIVQIYDVGEQDGQPFLVLEFIDGESLAARIAGKPQPVRLAAEITETLSRAMGYAHRQGIVHRDLKPANILLTPRGDSSSGATSVDGNSHGDPADFFAPKITDFGLAKRLDAGAGQTRTGEVLGTPSYMAPEQATGQAASAEPAVDIYALGVILYELLTGRPPFLGHSPLNTVDQVIRLDPVPPSRLQPRVTRDLDTICLKCLEKDPARRYATADQLADDLRRFLDGRPILARPTSTAVHVWRWSRRRPVAAATIVLSVVAALGLAAAGRWHNLLLRAERDRAEQNFGLAMRAVDEMLTEVGEKQLAYEPHMDQKRRVLLGKALDLCRLFLQQKAQDTRVQLETAHAYRRMGDIERWLNNYAQSAAAYQQALGILHDLRAPAPTNEEYRRWEGYCQNYLGEAYRQLSRTAEAEAAYQRAIAVEQELHGQFPHSAIARQDLARTHYNFGILYRESNRPAEAEEFLRRAIELLRPLASDEPADASCLQELARAHLNLGSVLRLMKRHSESVSHGDEAIRLLNALHQQAPDRPDIQFELAVAHTNRGNLRQNLGEKASAADDYELACTLLRKLTANHPHVPAIRQELANSYNSLAAIQAATDGLSAGEQTWLAAVAILRDLVARHDSVAAYRADLGMTLGNVAWVRARQERWSEARDSLREGIEQLEAVLSSNPAHPDYRSSLRSQLRQLAQVSLNLGDYEFAASTARRLCPVGETTRADAVVGGCLMLRSALLVEQDASLANEERMRRVDQFCREAANMLAQATGQGLRDVPQLAQLRELVRPRLESHPSLREAWRALAADEASPLP